MSISYGSDLHIKFTELDKQLTVQEIFEIIRMKDGGYLYWLIDLLENGPDEINGRRYELSDLGRFAAEFCQFIGLGFAVHHDDKSSGSEYNFCMLHYSLFA